MRNKRRPGKTPACLCALAVILSALGRLDSAPQVQAQTQAEWQDVAGGNFLTDSTVSGDIGKIIADTAPFLLKIQKLAGCGGMCL